jgi:hypothetical protein
MEQLALGFPSLTSLVPRAMEPVVLPMLGRLVQLKSLDVRLAANVQPPTASAVVSEAVRPLVFLTSLSLTRISFETTEDLSTLAAALPLLESLTFTDCSIAPNLLGLQSLKHLRELVLTSSFGALRAKDLEDLAPLSALRTIKITSRVWVAAELFAVRKMLQNLPCLQLPQLTSAIVD